jgi:hypothetical protein
MPLRHCPIIGQREGQAELFFKTLFKVDYQRDQSQRVEQCPFAKQKRLFIKRCGYGAVTLLKDVTQTVDDQVAQFSSRNG